MPVNLAHLFWSNFNNNSLFNKGSILFQNSNYNKALDCFRKCSQINPLCYHYHLKIGNCYEFLQNINEAVKFYDIEIELNPQNQIVYYAKGIFKLKHI